jgi:uncharacterized protein (TIGR02246 family)
MSETAQDQIRALVAGAVELMRVRDFKAIAGAYTQDGSLLLPRQPIAIGAEAIEKAWAKHFPYAFLALEYGPTRIDVAASGDLASEIGAYAMTVATPEGPLSDSGKYVVVWARTPEGWKIATDAVNSDLS